MWVWNSMVIKLIFIQFSFTKSILVNKLYILYVLIQNWKGPLGGTNSSKIGKNQQNWEEKIKFGKSGNFNETENSKGGTKWQVRK